MRTLAASLLLGISAWAPGSVPPSPAPESVAAMIEADEHYEARAAGAAGGRASATEISKAISGFERAAADPASAQARWKLARALYFFGSYTNLSEAQRRAAFDRARHAGDEAIAIVLLRRSVPESSSRPAAGTAGLLQGDPDAAGAFFWAAVGWGQWALASNKLEAARKGAARRIRDLCLTLIALDPGYEEGGGYRILGRLHDRAPRIPLLTGWISRAEGVRLLRLSVATAPRNPVNLHFLAEALAEGGDRGEAIRIEETVAAAPPSPGHRVEELSIQDAARKNLEAWTKSAAEEKAKVRP